ncbi:MAG TPA: hypothetical protein VK978_05360 [Candidatus Saccharimonadales bacterium]|nr:hypothetical protein [Candidatus Saccharimonadales bacterium]
MIESFRSSGETAPGPSTGAPETSTSKKNKKKARILGGITAEKVLEPPKGVREKAATADTDNRESLWQSLTKDETRPDKADKPAEGGLFEHAAASSADKPEVARIEQEDTIAPDEAEKAKAETAADAPEPPLEELSNAETQEAVRQYTEARLTDVRQESAEVQNNAPTAAETAADAALLESIQQKLAEEPERPVSEVLDEAEQEVVETIQAERTEGVEEFAAEVQQPPDAFNQEEREQAAVATEAAGQDTPEANGEVLEARDEETAEDDTVTAGTSSGGGGGGTHPPTGGSAGSTGTSGGAGGGSGRVPPHGPGFGGTAAVPPMGGGYGGGPAMAAARFNTAAASGIAAEQQLYINERAAVARGLVVGGVIGYLIGKRRGRIKTERKLAPVQEKLKAQVESLTYAVAQKEQRVRTLAAEKAAILQTQAEKQRFAERLRPAPAAEIVGAVPMDVKAAAKTAAKAEGTPRATASRAEVRPATGVRIPAPQAERLGRIIVEAPAAALAGAALGARAAEQIRDKPYVAVDFNKKVEAYSSEELKLASEKVRVDGVTLKEIQQTHNLDERAVRRVMTAFVEGGNVREALNREIVEKELKYERDPKLRQAKSGGKSGGDGAAASTGAAVLGLLGASGGKDNNAAGQGTGSAGNSGSKRPVPDQATLDKIRKKQAAELATVSVTIVTIFAVLIYIVAR